MLFALFDADQCLCKGLAEKKMEIPLEPEADNDICLTNCTECSLIRLESVTICVGINANEGIVTGLKLIAIYLY